MNIINLNQLKMNVQKFKVEIPSGFEAKNIQVIENNICYELVEVKKSVENIVNDYRSEITKSFCISTDSSIVEMDDTIWMDSYRNALPTKEKCEQILALEQLIMNCWIVNGCKELSRDEIKACIFRYKEGDKITIAEIDFAYFILNFTSLETAKEFYETYKELVEIAKPLL